MDTQKRILAINALKQSHTTIHNILHGATRDASDEIIKAEIARTIAMLANALTTF